MTIRCYAQRMLNPFRGALNIIEYKSAEAVCMDGLHWDIYVRDSELVSDLDNSHKILTNDIRYGKWSVKQGLKRGNIYPSDDFRVLEQLGTIVYEHLLQVHLQLPFKFEDYYELWLLDKHHQPLILINSVCHKQDIDLHQPIIWRSGNACQNTFQSKLLQTKTDYKYKNAATFINHTIQTLAGKSPSAQWFKRRPDLSATGLDGINLNPELNHRYLNHKKFPQLLISPESSSAIQQQLMNDFFAWQAPWLLVLQNISDYKREQLEQHALKQAQVVEQQFRLYPKIINPNFIKTARVEAMMRNNQNASKKEENEVMSIEFIELDNSNNRN